MGDIATHAMIAEKIMAVLERERPGEDYIFFELGNWLTDMSQFRDPPAHVGAKRTIWEAAQTGAASLPGALELYAKFNLYLDDLMGVPGRDGDLAKWFREIVFVNGCEKFRQPIGARPGIDVEEFKDIFSSYWTQYYPHEHLDFPPFEGKAHPWDSPSKKALHRCQATARPAGGGMRKVKDYLDKHIEYLGLLLTLIEDKWAMALPTDSNKKERHKILARYGHVSHAVEDFFFHSNFTEMAWAKLHRDEDLGREQPPRHRRRFYRRLRAPARYNESTKAEYLYTGAFGSKDVFHTLMDAAEGIRQNAESGELKDVGLAMLLEKMLEPDEAKQAAYLQEHRTRLETGYYVTSAKSAESKGKLHPESVKAIESMSKIDLELGRKYPKVANPRNDVPLGVFGFMQQLAQMARREEEESERESAELDADEAQVRQNKSNNGASAENIGSHTLLAKDSERKEPMRAQAINLATCTAVYVAKTMVERVKQSQLAVSRFDHDAEASSAHGATNTQDTGRIDWIHLLQHFLSHPNEAEGPGLGWWEKALSDEAAETYHNPKLIPSAEVKHRIQLEETARKFLERSYDQLTEIAQQRGYRPGTGAPF